MYCHHLLPVFLSYIFYCVNNHAFVVLFFFVSSCGCVHCLPLEPHERTMYKSAPVDRQQANRTCMHVQIITIIHTHTTVLSCIVLYYYEMLIRFPWSLDKLIVHA
jgi:hypothetical protein